MIVVGLGIANHDCSICVCINGSIKYHKYEREVGIKHAQAPDYWYWKKLIEWGVDLDSIDMIIQTDNYTFHNDHKIPKRPHNGESVLQKRKNHFIIDHHLAHCWSNTQFATESQSVIVDGRGSGNHSSMIYQAGEITRSKSTAPGQVFWNLGKALNFSGLELDFAGKVMGLLSYGSPNNEIVQLLKQHLPDNLHQLPIYDWITDINSTENLDDLFINLASFNEICYQYIENLFSQLDKSKSIVYAGGCALNVDWNRRLQDQGYQLIVEPHVYDGGLSVGCMRYGLHLLGESAEFNEFPYCQQDQAPETMPSDDTVARVADLLAQGKIVGWYQGHGEIGPRALGNRSILMDPTISDGKNIINNKVKHREWWRPFGASVKQDQAHRYFDLSDSPYMLYTSNVLDSSLKSVTHVDGTCRHQTVSADQNMLYYSLLDAFENKTGIPVLLNTSLNLGGKPIASDPAEAIELLNNTELDAVCIGNQLIVK